MIPGSQTKRNFLVGPNLEIVGKSLLRPSHPALIDWTIHFGSMQETFSFLPFSGWVNSHKNQKTQLFYATDCSKMTFADLLIRCPTPPTVHTKTIDFTFVRKSPKLAMIILRN